MTVVTVIRLLRSAWFPTTPALSPLARAIRM